MSTKMFDLSGRRALVTGSSQGIGFALATGLGAAGAEIIVNARRQGPLDEAVAALKAQGIKAAGVVFDVTDYNQVVAGIARIEDEIGPIDILVNNAGIQRRSPLEDFPVETWHEVIQTNLNSVFYVGQTVAKRMIPRKHGKIINIASLTSELARFSIAPYAAAKSAVKLLTKSMCTEWAKHNIQANAIGPGYFATPLNKALVEDEKFNSWITTRTPAGRWGKVEELQGACIFLASSASDFVNGQTIYVDGGFLAQM